MLVECENCKQNFELVSGETDSNLTHKKEYVINGQSIFLTYYDCPSCGRRHFVQIDNKASLAKLREVKKQFVDLAKAKKKGKEISQKQSAKFKKARESLSDYRRKLMEEHTGISIWDNDECKTFELRFSI